VAGTTVASTAAYGAKYMNRPALLARKS